MNIRSSASISSAALLVLLLWPASGNAQHAPITGGGVFPPSSQTTPGTRMPDVSGERDTTPDPFRDKIEATRARALKDDRHKRLAADADKLLALATELKAEVDKTTKDELSVVVVKKAGEMEKLAHDLKERMRN